MNRCCALIIAVGCLSSALASGFLLYVVQGQYRPHINNTVPNDGGHLNIYLGFAIVGTIW